MILVARPRSRTGRVLACVCVWRGLEMTRRMHDCEPLTKKDRSTILISSLKMAAKRRLSESPWTIERRAELQVRIAALDPCHMGEILQVIFGEIELKAGDEFTIYFESLSADKCQALDELVTAKSAPIKAVIKRPRKSPVPADPDILPEEIIDEEEVAPAPAPTPAVPAPAPAPAPAAAPAAPPPPPPPEESVVVEAPAPAPVATQEEKESHPAVEEEGMVKLGGLPCRLEVKLAADDEFHACSLLAVRGGRHLALYDDELSLQWIESNKATTREASKPVESRRIGAGACDKVLSWLCALDVAEIVLRFDEPDAEMTLSKVCDRLARREVKSGSEFAAEVRAVHDAVMHFVRRKGLPKSWSAGEEDEEEDELEELAHAAQVLAAAFEHKWTGIETLQRDDGSWDKPYARPRRRPSDDGDLFGHVVDIYWGVDSAWYRCKLRRPGHVRGAKGKVRCEYVDGSVELLELSSYAVRVVEFPNHPTPRGGGDKKRSRPVYFPERKPPQVLSPPPPKEEESPPKRREVKKDLNEVAALYPYLSKQPPRRCRERREQPLEALGATRGDKSAVGEESPRSPSPPTAANFSCHKLGKLVWAKSGSHPWWPAELCILVLDELVEAFPPTGVSWNKGYRKCMVLYFNNGEAEFDLLSPHTAVVPYDPEFPRARVQPSHNSKQLDEAIALAIKRADHLGFISTTA